MIHSPVSLCCGLYLFPAFLISIFFMMSNDIVQYVYLHMYMFIHIFFFFFLILILLHLFIIMHIPSYFISTFKIYLLNHTISLSQNGCNHVFLHKNQSFSLSYRAIRCEKTIICTVFLLLHLYTIFVLFPDFTESRNIMLHCMYMYIQYLVSTPIL